MNSVEQNGDGYPETSIINLKEDILSESDASNDAFEWLVTQNNELKEKLKTIEQELHHWKTYANDCKEKLNRIHQNREKHNYVDAFYDPTVKKLIQSLSEDNVELKKELLVKNELSGKDGVYEMCNAINTLHQQLNMHKEENRILKDEMKNKKCINCSKESKEKLVELETMLTTTKMENMNLRNQINNQMDIMSYVKSQFSMQRNEFIMIFTEQYLKNGDIFINQLKLLDADVPDFLKKPLKCDVSTSIDSSFVSDKNGSMDILPPSQKVKEFKESPESINQRLRKTIKEKDESIRCIEQRTKSLEEGIRIKEKQLEDANDEWRVVYGQVYSKLEKLQKQYEQLETYCRHLENRNDELKKVQTTGPDRPRSASVSADVLAYARKISQNTVPTLLARGISVPSSTSTLCRDSPAKVNEFSSSSRTLSTSNVEQKDSTQTDMPDPTEKKSVIFCKNCKRDIQSEKYQMHITYCGKSGSHMC